MAFLPSRSFHRSRMVFAKVCADGVPGDQRQPITTAWVRNTHPASESAPEQPRAFSGIGRQSMAQSRARLISFAARPLTQWLLLSEMAPVRPSITAFFPAYNDAGTIASMVVSTDATLRTLTDDYEIIVVNDGSPDHTAQVLADLEPHYPR